MPAFHAPPEVVDRVCVRGELAHELRQRRAVSRLRCLRHGFAGELRAVGNVLRDQLSFMVRCGFDSFAVADARPLDGWESALSEIDVVYQPATDRRAPVTAARAERAAVAANWAY